MAHFPEECTRSPRTHFDSPIDSDGVYVWVGRVCLWHIRLRAGSFAIAIAMHFVFGHGTVGGGTGEVWVDDANNFRRRRCRWRFQRFAQRVGEFVWLCCRFANVNGIASYNSEREK